MAITISTPVQSPAAASTIDVDMAIASNSTNEQKPTDSNILMHTHNLNMSMKCLPTTLLSLDAELEAIHPHAQLLVEEEALRILARSKRRKLDDIPYRERWRCPNEACGREYKRTSTTSIGHHREACPHRPILKARALYQLNPLLKAHLEMQNNFQHVNPHIFNNGISVEQLQQFQQFQQQQQAQMRAQSMNINAFSSVLPSQITPSATIPSNSMMVNMSSLLAPSENTLFTSTPSVSLQSNFSQPSINHLQPINYIPLASANTTSNSTTLPILPNNVDIKPLTSTFFQPNIGGVTNFPIMNHSSIPNNPFVTVPSATSVEVSNPVASPSVVTSTGTTLMRPIARRRVDIANTPSVIISSTSNSLPNTPRESPRSLYFTAPGFSFPFQKIATPVHEKL